MSLIAIALKDSSKLEKAKELLEREGIEFEVGTGFEHFCFDEADSRLEGYEENREVQFPETLRSKMEDRIANRFYESYILDGEYMDEIVAEEVKEILEENDLTLESFE